MELQKPGQYLNQQLRGFLKIVQGFVKSYLNNFIFLREMSLRYAQVERNLGEIDRARAIYAHCAEICDPRVIF